MTNEVNEEIRKDIIPSPVNKGNGSGACQAFNVRGEPCRGIPQNDSEYCFAHDPERVEDRAEWRKLGGASNRAKHSQRVNPGHIPKEVRSIDDLLLLLDYVKDEMFMLSNGLNRNKALVQLASTYAAVLKDANMEDRLGDLEAEMLGLLEKAKATRTR